MTKATRVHSTPPPNTPIDTKRRRFLAVAAGASVVSVGTLAVAAAIPTAALTAAQTLDAELIDLGARFEPLVDRYYVAHRCWSAALAQAHAEHDREFGDPADRNFEYPPEIRKAFEDSCERWGVREASDELSAIFKEMAPLANAINAASVTSIEGFRAKALVAFWEIAPLCINDTEFSFEDALSLQQLVIAVAELCGLKEKKAATSYQLPDIGSAYEDSEDDCGDEAE